MIKQLTIFGVGLIGGSLALALRKNGFCQKVVGCSRNAEQLQRAVDLNVIDEFTLDPAAAVKHADMVLLAVPLGAMESVLASMVDHLPPNVVVTDAGSSKASVVAAAQKVFGQVPDFFIPAHPIAGREKSGVEAALAELYVNHKVILTPLENASPDAIRRVTEMWQACGAEVQSLGVAQHDLVLAATSHLPHVLAYSLVDTLSQTDYVDEIFQFAAGGFRDVSRTASSDPVMWRDICLENRDGILDVLESFESNLAGLRTAIESGDGTRLLDIFTHAKTIRDNNVLKHLAKPE
ncbi:MAG: prephenate dehydrogenase [Mariniblastus sp.]|jgi:prephenate dehydrogenase